MRKITEVYRHRGEDGVKAEYRFEKNVFIGFFLNDKKDKDSSDKYKDCVLDAVMEENLKSAGFINYRYEVEI